MSNSPETQNDIGNYLDTLVTQRNQGEIGDVSLTIYPDEETGKEYGETRTGFPIMKIKIIDTEGNSKTVFQR